MICKKQVEKYCCEDISKIENYKEAIADTTQMWDCHHRMELIKTGAVVDSTMQDLIDWDIYYNRPADELIFLTPKDHKVLHYKGKKGKPRSEEAKRKISEASKGRKMPPRSEEWKRRQSDVHKGQKAWNKGMKGVYHQSEEFKRKLSEAIKGHSVSEETKRKMSEVVKTVRDAYKEYKANGGELSWNSFRRFYAKKS
jgi:hypothetical protein